MKNQSENHLVKSDAAGVTSSKPTYFFLERYMPAYEIEWAAFAEALSGGLEMPVTLADGVAALAMAEAAVRSFQKGETIRLADV